MRVTFMTGTHVTFFRLTFSVYHLTASLARGPNVGATSVQLGSGAARTGDLLVTNPNPKTLSQD